MQNKAWIFASMLLLVIGCGANQNADDAQYADKMSEEHKDDSPTPSPTAQEEPTDAVDATEVAYATVDGNDVKGYLSRPQNPAPGAPAIIVIQEWWGLNDNIRAMADKLAGEGYLALAVDLYGGESASDPEGARALMMAAMEKDDALEENLRQAHAYLEQQGAGNVGSIGWCFGGGWSLRTGLALPDQLDAVVIYYGRVITDRDQLAALQMPVLGIFGALDQGIPVESVKEFETALAEIGKEAQIHIYEDADHAFANPSGTRYNAEAAEDAWGKTLDFLAAHLQG